MFSRFVHATKLSRWYSVYQASPTTARISGRNTRSCSPARRRPNARDVLLTRSSPDRSIVVHIASTPSTSPTTRPSRRTRTRSETMPISWKSVEQTMTAAPSSGESTKRPVDLQLRRDVDPRGRFVEHQHVAAGRRAIVRSRPSGWLPPDSVPDAAVRRVRLDSGPLHEVLSDTTQPRRPHER